VLQGRDKPNKKDRRILENGQLLKVSLRLQQLTWSLQGSEGYKQKNKIRVVVVKLARTIIPKVVEKDW